MKNKLKITGLTVLSVICLQAPMTAFAVELPLVPVEREETVTTAVSDNDTLTVTKKQASAARVTTQNHNTTKVGEKNTKIKKSASASDSALADNSPVEKADRENNALPVISSDGEVVEKLGTRVSAENEPSEIEKSTTTAENSSMPESSDISFSDDKNSTDTQTMAQGEIGTSNQKSESNSLPIIVAVICCVVVLAGTAVFAIFKKGKK